MTAESSGSQGIRDSHADLEKIRETLLVAVSQTCPAWLAADAEDIVQEAMIKVLRIIGQDEEKSRLSSSYLWRVAYSATIDEIRRRRRRREVAMDDEVLAAQSGAPGPSPEQVALGGGIGQAIRGCLATLAPARRKAVTLRLLGHSIPEVASLLGWNGKRAENLTYRGLADLRRCLERRGIRP